MELQSMDSNKRCTGRETRYTSIFIESWTAGPFGVYLIVRGWRALPPILIDLRFEAIDRRDQPLNHVEKLSRGGLCGGRSSGRTTNADCGPVTELPAMTRHSGARTEAHASPQGSDTLLSVIFAGLDVIESRERAVAGRSRRREKVDALERRLASLRPRTVAHTRPSATVRGPASVRWKPFVHRPCALELEASSARAGRRRRKVSPR